MLKLIIATILIIVSSVFIIGYANDKNLEKCYNMGGNPLLNNKGDVIGCTKLK